MRVCELSATLQLQVPNCFAKKIRVLSAKNSVDLIYAVTLTAIP